MGILNTFVRLVDKFRVRTQRNQPGSLGDFWRSGGNELLVSSLPLGSGDLAIDGGGYKGHWADEILCRYGAHLIIYEPIPEFCSNLSSRYQKNTAVNVRCTALSKKAGRTNIIMSDDGSSLFAGSGQHIEITLERLVDSINNLKIDRIGCLKLNIEGGEYDVLEDLLDSNEITRIACLLVQFHRIDEESLQRRKRIQDRLKMSHRNVFDYPFVWERWDRISERTE